MAVGNTTQWGSRTGLDQIFAPGFEDAVYRNNDFLGLVANGTVLFPESPLTTGLDYRWRLNTAGNSSAAIFTEGAGAPQPVAQTYVNLTATPVYFWAWTRVTGHVRDAIRNGGAVNGLNPIANEFVAGFEDIKDLMNTTFMASTYGLTQIVDSGNTVFGVAQGSNAWHAASETPVGGALTLAGMTNLVETIRDNDKGGKPKAILTAHNQITNYIALMGVVAASNAAPRVELSVVGGSKIDLGPDPAQAAFQNVPMVGLGDFDDSTMVWVDQRPTRFGPNWQLKTARYLEVRGPQMAGDDDVFELSTARAMVCHLVKLNGKLGTLTA